MSLGRILGIVLLVVGGFLLFEANEMANSPAGQVAEALTGTQRDQTTWYMVGGFASVIAGLLLAVFGGRR